MTATVCMWVGIYLSVNFYGSGTPWFWGTIDIDRVGFFVASLDGGKIQ